jgi:hypothetical protein
MKADNRNNGYLRILKPESWIFWYGQLLFRVRREPSVFLHRISNSGHGQSLYGRAVLYELQTALEMWWQILSFGETDESI